MRVLTATIKYMYIQNEKGIPRFIHFCQLIAGRFSLHQKKELF